MHSSSLRRILPSIRHFRGFSTQIVAKAGNRAEHLHQRRRRLDRAPHAYLRRRLCSAAPEQNLNNLLSALDEASHAGDARRADGLMKRITALGCESVCKASVYNAVLRANAKARELQKVDQLYTEMQIEGIQCDAKSFSTAIEAFVEEGELIGAEIWLNRMQAMNISPGKEIFDMALSSCAKTGQILEAERWFETMYELDIVPDSQTLSHIVSVYARGGEFSRLREWVAQLRRDSVVLDADIYGCIIEACAREGDIAEVKYWVEEVNRLGGDLNRDNYRVLISAFSNAGLPEMASEMVHTMIEKKMDPDASNFANVIEAYVRCGNPEIARSWLDRAMQSRRVNIQCFMPLAEWYGQQRQPKRVLKLFEEAENLNVNLNLRDFYMLVFKALSMVKDKQNVELMTEMLRKMNEKEILDVAACNLVLSAASDMTDTSLTMNLFEEIRQYVVPNDTTCSIVMRKLERTKPDAAVDFLLNMLLNYGVPPTIAHYNSALASCIHVDDFESGKRIFMSMLNAGVTPSADTFCILTSAHARRGEVGSVQRWYKISEKYGLERHSRVICSVAEAYFNGSSSKSGRGQQAAKRRALMAMEWLRSVNKDGWSVDAEDTKTLVKRFLKAHAESAAKECFERYIGAQREKLANRSSASMAELKSGKSVTARIGMRNEEVEIENTLEQIHFIFIQYFHSTNNKKNVAKWLDSAIQSSVRLSPRWFSMAIGVNIKRGDIPEARRRFLQLFDLGVMRTAIIYRQMASIAIADPKEYPSDRTPEARLIGLMKQDGLVPNIKTFLPMLGLAAKRARGGHDEARRVQEVLRLMEAENIQPDELCRRYILEALSRSKSKSFEMLEKEILKSATNAITRAFTYLNGSRVDAALQEITEMIHSGKEPSEPLTTRMLQSLLKENRRDEAENLYFLLNPTQFDFTLLGAEYAHRGNVKKVLELLSYLSDKNPSDVDLDCIQIVLQACNEANPKDYDTAREVLQKLRKLGVSGKESTKRRVKLYLQSLLGKEAEDYLNELSFHDIQKERHEKSNKARWGEAELSDFISSNEK
mmetsp:Transcript_17582/g.42911  ORF Transcript_17582/g.42911 Transcript_17582/m.42911 type:complete len:1047 (-) Transcript_17582:99-3239(-)